MKLSILMPVDKERAVVDAAVKRVLDVQYSVEIELDIKSHRHPVGVGR